ncbi:STAS/SEC14 domain-containing protein [uncultured Lutibacter sp.]|uniref:STAS/SEC14 domain-containing protein n=1 Tax=uncultured Lutibacter sp. TaxID=437739 RepID=UPI0026152AFE|nr:STAS/SEC14 domain-containing protein [uncultured Lutibacter sp.]
MIVEKFNKISYLLEVTYSDNVSAKEIIDYIKATKENNEYPRILKIISDAKKATFNFSIEELEQIVKENYKSLEKYNKIIDAIIVDNPKNTVLTVLYKRFFNTEKYKFEIFATKEAALKWLSLW